MHLGTTLGLGVSDNSLATRRSVMSRRCASFFAAFCAVPLLWSLSACGEGTARDDGEIAESSSSLSIESQPIITDRCVYGCEQSLSKCWSRCDSSNATPVCYYGCYDVFDSCVLRCPSPRINHTEESSRDGSGNVVNYTCLSECLSCSCQEFEDRKDNVLCRIRWRPYCGSVCDDRPHYECNVP